MEDALIESVLAEYAEKFPASISIQQAAEIAGVSVLTLYDWSSRGLLDAFKSKFGRRVRLSRDAFVRHLLRDDE